MAPNSKKIRILSIEDNPGDARFFEEMLKEAGFDFELKCVDRLSSGIGKIKSDSFDVILLDLGLPDSQGLATLTKLNEIKPEAPVIVLTGLEDETIGTKAVKAGAQDYLIKGQLDKNLLARSIRYAIERKQAEEALLKSEAALKEAQRVGQIGSWDWDAVGDTITWSEEYYRIFNFDPNVPPPNYQNHLNIYTAESAERLDAAVKKTVQTGEPYELDLEIARLTGPTRWICARSEAKRDADGRIVGLRGTAQNISERKKAEKALVERDAFIRNILEAVDEGFIMVDRQYRIMSANKAFCRFENIQEGQVLGRLCYEVSHHCNRPCFEAGEECAVKRTFETGAPQSGSHTHVSENGTKYHVEIKSYPVTDALGDVVSAIETITDVTEKVKIEAQLRHDQKMEAVGTLAGGIAHDFNNILNVIIGYGTMVMDRIGDDQLAREHMHEVLTAADRAANLTKRLLLFSRKEVAEFKPVDVNELVINMEKMLSRIIGEDINLVADLMGTKAMVMADAGQMEQVLMNLATNARDAMPEGGSLTIKTELREIDAEFIKAYEYGVSGAYAVISITDTGTGIDKEKQLRIFDPFFTSKEVGKGTGLGLSIAYGIIKQHKGYIKVYSEPGKGTTFKIWLPVIEDTAEKKPEVESFTSLKGGTETILVAEDDASMRKLTSTVLEAFGYSVITAEDGEEAIMKFMENKDRIALVVLDMIMPKKSGKEVSEAIREKRPLTKILFVSGYTMDIIKTQELTAAGFDFINKPVLPKDLVKKVREILDR